MAKRSLSKWLNILVILSILLPSGAANAFSARTQPQAPVDSAIFRTTIKVDGAARWKRLEQLQIKILAEGTDWAEVLVTAPQLETLARLRFEPSRTDGVDSLIKTAVRKTPKLALEFNGLLAQADQVAASESDRETALKAAIAGLDVEQANALATLAAVDDDADGLTNTQEQWWCTNPLNPDSDNDGKTDGAEIQIAKDWVANRRAGPPGETPWASWPFNSSTCPDKDHDSIPNMAEMELGLNMDWESTDGDKYDDGQELFGVTYCPGGDLTCGYGDLPRSSDSGYVGATLPTWVNAPGNHPLVAAYPRPEVDIIPSSFYIQTVTVITTDHIIQKGEENQYSTSETKGVEVSSSDTVTWNEWEENSVTKPLTGLMQQFTPLLQLTAKDSLGLWKLMDGRSTTYRALSRGADSVENFDTLAQGAKTIGTGIGYGINWLVYEGALLANSQPLDLDFSRDDYDPNGALAEAQANQYDENMLNALNLIAKNVGDLSENGSSYGPDHNLACTPNPHSPVIDNIGKTRIQTGIPFQYPVPRPVATKTETRGSSNGGAHTETTSQSESHTITNGQSFSNSEAWGNATAQDSAHASDLWFSYNITNRGEDYATKVGNIVINIYLNDEKNPFYTYSVGSDIAVDGYLHNLMPGSQNTFTSRRIPLTLEQMKLIDLGGKIHFSVESFDYGTDELFYQNALGKGVLVGFDDGSLDGDENIDSYLIPTWGSETVLDVIAHYFPYEYDAMSDSIVAFWTPEKTTVIPAWCQESKVQGTQVWCKHKISTAEWWNVTTTETTDSSNGFSEALAVSGSKILFRFNQDTDLDGYSDRSEIRFKTDSFDPTKYPKPELIGGISNQRNGDIVTSTISFLNSGLYDAYGIEAIMVAPDDTISIIHNTVGGSGHVRSQAQLIVGNRILPPSYTSGTWNGTAKPGIGGYYTGTNDRTYTFSTNCSISGGCDVGSGIWTASWIDDKGGSGTLNFGDGYQSPKLVPVDDFGVSLSFLTGKVYPGNQFTIQARISRATFEYRVNREPHSQPIVIVSYNDPQGQHRFILPVSVMDLPGGPIDLENFSGTMLQGSGVQIVSTSPVSQGQNVTALVINNSTGRDILNSLAHFVIFGSTGYVVSKVSSSQSIPPGPSVIELGWDTSSFIPAYDPTMEYVAVVYWTDYEGNILNAIGRPLSSFQIDPKPSFAMNTEDSTWNFGTAAQGTVMKRTFSFANTGRLELLTYVEAPAGVNVSQTGSHQVDPADLTSYEIALNTSNMPLGVYDKTITIHTSDPAIATRTVHVTGTVTTGTVDTPAGAVQRPLDYPAVISGSHTMGEWYDFAHPLGPDPASLQPVKVYSQDYSKLWGVGKYATNFGQGTASSDMFGDGRDGTMPTSGNLDNNNGFGIGIVNSGGYGAYSINITDVYADWRINSGDVVLIHQTQGSGAGCWELNKAISNPVGGTEALQLAKPLQCNYTSGGSNHAQIVRVPQYASCSVSGTATPLTSWNGSWGGIFAVLCNGTMNITGSIQADGGAGSIVGNNSDCVEYGGGGTGNGFRGGNGFRSHWASCGGWGDVSHSAQQGESPQSAGSYSDQANGSGGGGGPGDNRVTGGGGGGGYGTNGQTGGGSDGAPIGGIGGGTIGTADLSQLHFGSGGGGGQKWYSYNAGGGGSGGGIVFISAKQLNVSGMITANGGNGASANQPGGGGSGGSVLIRTSTATIGTSQIVAYGGAAGVGQAQGGSGGVGRIRIEYCDSASGATNPAASTQKLSCYIVEQAADPTHTRLNLPETFSNGQTYQIQYGRKLDFTIPNNILTSTLRVPAGLLATTTLDALISGVGTGTANFKLDIGNDGTWDWTPSPSGNDSATLSSSNLSTAFNAYWVSHGAPSSENLDVPIRVSMDKPGQVLLTNLQVTSGGSKLRYLRIPANTYDTITLNHTLSGGSGSSTVAIDVGDNGSIDATWSGTPPSYPASLTSNNLAAAVNAYLAGKTYNVDVDIPIRFFVAPDHTLSLNSFSATPANKSDAGVTNPDMSLPGTPPVEGETVTVGVTLHNTTTQDTGGLTVAFYATSPDWGDWYIGSTLVENVFAGGAALASVPWNTLGFTGSVPIKVVVDPYDRLAENSETNNQATATLTILTRPDLTLSAIALSDTEPAVGETVSLSLTERNQGQTLAGASLLKVYDGDPAKSGTLICDNPINSISGGSDQPSTCNWSPSQAGLHRLFVVSDAAQAVPEFDEGNNLSWQDVYVGLAGPVQIDSGLETQDPVYTSATGFGFVDPGANDRTVACSIGSDTDPRISTLRRDPSGQIEYRFDHLLPHHNYHLDLILYECDGAGRQESVSVDNSLLQGPVDLGDAKAHYLSLRLDPALYQTDQSIRVSITVPDTSGAVVAAVNLVDVDYRYADAGGSSDPQYSAANRAGWLDGTMDQTYGTLPYQSIRVDQDNNDLQYRYDGLKASKHYQLHLTFWQPSGTAHLQKVQIDNIDSGQLIDTGDYQLHPLTIIVPQAAYAGDGSIVVTVQRTNAVTGAILNEIALEELTLQQPLTCSELNVRPTPYFSETYGTLSFFGMPAAVGETRVEALTPRGEVVGCFLVSTEGQYGLMRIYGEDFSTQPTTPGARTGERITFRVNGSYAYATPATYWQNDHAAHNVDLVVKTLTDQSIALNPGWNLISFGGEPPTPLIRMLLGSALARTNRMIGETGLFTSSLADTFVTLKELHANQGYYLFLNGTTTLNWLVGGDPAATSTSIPLHTGWNWIGGPRSSMTVAAALQSIDGHYKRVLGLEKTYDPSLPPSYSPLKDLKPGEGYLIYITDPVSLTYQTGTGDALPTDKFAPVCLGLAPTPALTIVYGEVRINKALAPAGTRVEIRTPRGELAGCALIAEPGLLALTHVYGADNESAGFREGESLSFYVNGLRAVSDKPLVWSNNREINEIHLSGDGTAIYLPWINGR